jgi:hypothetical protein
MRHSSEGEARRSCVRSTGLRGYSAVGGGPRGAGLPVSGYRDGEAQKQRQRQRQTQKQTQRDAMPGLEP